MPVRVSIIIPVYNGSEYLEQAITSALSQTESGIEVIVINDGSKDDGRTEAVALGFGERIIYIAKENGGVASALNRGIMEAKGELISWLSHDDIYEPDKIEKQLALLDSMPESQRKTTILHTNCSFIDENSMIYDRSHMTDVGPGRFYQSLLCGRTIRSLFDISPFSVNGCTALFPKVALVEGGLFDESLKTTQDYDLWFKLCGRYDFRLMEEPLLRSRVHKGQGTYTMRGIMSEEVDRLYARALTYFNSGSPRYDLDLPKAALALRLDPRKRAAFRTTFALAVRNIHRFSDLIYLGLALFWNPWFARGQIALTSMKRRIRMRSAEISAKHH